MTATDPKLARYHRQMLLPGIGPEGQARLSKSHVIIVGVGALGCASADLLARAGVGTLTLVDRDVVELTNLQRQTLFDERDACLMTPKAQAAAARLKSVNSSIEIRPLVLDVVPANAEQVLCSGHRAGALSCIVDGTDNFETRYLMNDVSVKHGIPYAYGGAVGTRGMACTFVPGGTGPCLRCLFEHVPAPGTAQTCDTAGVLGPSVSMVAACQATEVIKVLVGREDQLSGSLLDFDVWANSRRTIDVRSLKPPSCPCCGARRFEFLEGAAGSDVAVLCGQNAVQVSPARSGLEGLRVDLAVIAERLRPHADVVSSQYLVRATTNTPGGASPLAITVFQDGRAIVSGTTKVEVARSMYAKYVGA